MHLTWRQTLVMAVTIGTLFGAYARVCQADSAISGSPRVVTMSGTLQPFNEQDSHGLNMLTVTIGGKQKWLFYVKRVETVTDAQPGVMLLNQVFPPELSIEGSTSNMALLEEPRVVGKPVTLQGFLYISDRTFYVGDVSVIG
jgi:hypothetical protein